MQAIPAVAATSSTPAMLPANVCKPERGSAMGVHSYGVMGVDWEERVRYDRLREERLARAKRGTGGVRAGRAAVLRHVEHPLHHGDPHRHLGLGQAQPLLPAAPGRRADHVGLRLGRPPPPALQPVARRGALARRDLDDARRDVAGLRPRRGRRREDPRRAGAARPARRAGRRRRGRAAGAVRAADAPGIKVVDGQQLMQEIAHDQDPRTRSRC